MPPGSFCNHNDTAFQIRFSGGPNQERAHRPSRSSTLPATFRIRGSVPILQRRSDAVHQSHLAQLTTFASDRASLMPTTLFVAGVKGPGPLNCGVPFPGNVGIALVNRACPEFPNSYMRTVSPVGILDRNRRTACISLQNLAVQVPR